MEKKLRGRPLKLEEEFGETKVGLEKLQSAKTTAETWEALDEIQDGSGDMLMVIDAYTVLRFRS
jgi:hypothetical protein